MSPTQYGVLVPAPTPCQLHQNIPIFALPISLTAMTKAEISQFVEELLELSELSVALEVLEAYLDKAEAAEEAKNTLVLLQSRNHSNEKDFKLSNTLTKEQFDTERNKILLAVMDLLKELPENATLSRQQAEALAVEVRNKQKQLGKILYSIPNQMQVQKSFTCIVRIASNKIDMSLLEEGIDMSQNTNVENLPRISEVMRVSLSEAGTSNFEITPLNSQAEQLIVPDEYTEWRFRVKPLAAGSHLLLLQVSVIEIVPGFGERKKDIKVLEKDIEVLTTEVEEPQAQFEVAKETILPFDTQQHESPNPQNQTKRGGKAAGIGLASILTMSVVFAALVGGGLGYLRYTDNSEAEEKQRLDSLMLIEKTRKKEDSTRNAILKVVELLPTLDTVGVDTLPRPQIEEQKIEENDKRESPTRIPKPPATKRTPPKKKTGVSTSTPPQPERPQPPISTSVPPRTTTAPSSPSTVREPVRKQPEPPLAAQYEKLPQAKNINRIRRRMDYPKRLLATGKEGEVLCAVRVDEDGKYMEHSILKSSDPLFTAEVEKYIKDLKFKPAQKDGKPVACWISIPFKFSVKDE